MNPEAQRIAIAEACGWFDIRIDPKKPSVVLGTKSFGHIGCEEFEIPDYLNDLNAMHEAEKVLTKRADRVEYTGWLNTLVGHKFSWEATAAQRAEAFLKCLNLWTP